MELERIAKMLDKLEEEARTYNDASLYVNAMEFYKNHGYVIIYNGNHQVFHKVK